MIFCGMLLPLLALEISRPEGLTEYTFELQSSAIIAGGFRCGLIRGECMREFHPALSATTNVVPLSLSLSASRVLPRDTCVEGSTSGMIDYASTVDIAATYGIVGWRRAL